MCEDLRCAHCGRTDLGTVTYVVVCGKPVCVPTVGRRPDCALLVGRFGHPFDCRCEEPYPVAGDRAMILWA